MRLDRITSSGERMNGQPCIRNLRITVRRVLEALATYPDREEFHREYPELEARIFGKRWPMLPHHLMIESST